MSGDNRILMTTGAILRFLHERGLCVSRDTLARWTKAEQHPFPVFRLTPGPTAPVCARVAAVESWLAECEGRALEAVG